SFSDAKQEPQFVPFASLSMECVSKAPVSKLHPPLPLRPEEAIIISPENKKQTQEVGAEDIRRALGLQASHHFFIRSIELLLFSVGVIIVAIWLTIVRGGSLEKKEKLVPRNFFDECHHILESKAPFNQRVMMLSVWTREFFSHLFQKDMVYSTTQEMVPNIEDAVILDEAQRGMCVQYLQELEKAEFSRDHLNEEAWSKVAEQARSIVTLFRTA
ncbi:MAG TPA: hypothetical protein VN457_00130, partial [Chlamydiales bacterium]|nr:hypothetical protein [Chlamydiales bacterium]